jgi:large subunit ribosomal protein L9e
VQSIVFLLTFDVSLVKITVKARKVTVTGPRGTIVKDLSHMQMDLKIMNMATKKVKGMNVRIQMWNAKYKFACGTTTIKSIINNMFIGVTQVSLLSSHLRTISVFIVF